MLYLTCVVFALCAIIKLFQHDTNGFFMFSVLVGLYLIPVTIEAIYQRYITREDAKTKAMADAFKNFNEEMKKSGSTKNNAKIEDAK